MEGRPRGDSRQLTRPDVVDELLHEPELGLQHGDAQQSLDEEHVGNALLADDVDRGAFRAELDGEAPGPLLQQSGHLAGAQAAHQREGGFEGGELAGRHGQQLAEPVLELGVAGGGDRVDRPLGTAAVADRLLRFDEAVLLQGVDHGVEGAVVELDALLLAPGPQGRGDLVRVHRPLGQAAEDGQGERVVDPATCHDLHLRSEYSEWSMSRRAIQVKLYRVSRAGRLWRGRPTTENSTRSRRVSRRRQPRSTDREVHRPSRPVRL